MRRSGRRASMALALLMCLVLTSGLTVATIASGEPRGEPAVATILEWIETRIDPEGVTVILRGNGQLVAGAIREAEDLPPRLVFDLPNVESGVPSVTYVELGPLEKIRVAAYSREPLVTRVVFDLRRQGMYRVEPDVDEGGLTVVFRDQEALVFEPEVLDRTDLIELNVADRADVVEVEAADRTGAVEPEVVGPPEVVEVEVADRTGEAEVEVGDQAEVVEPEVVDGDGAVEPEVVDPPEVVEVEVADRAEVVEPGVVDGADAVGPEVVDPSEVVEVEVADRAEVFEPEVADGADAVDPEGLDPTDFTEVGVVDRADPVEAVALTGPVEPEGLNRPDLIEVEVGDRAEVVEPEVVDGAGAVEPEVVDPPEVFDVEVADRIGAVEVEVADRAEAVESEAVDGVVAVGPEVVDPPEVVDVEAADRTGAVEAEVGDRAEVVEPEVVDGVVAIGPEVVDPPEVVDVEVADWAEAVESEAVDGVVAVGPEVVDPPEVVDVEVMDPTGAVEVEVGDLAEVVEPEVVDGAVAFGPEVVDPPEVVDVEVTDRPGAVEVEVGDRAEVVEPEVVDGAHAVGPEVVDLPEVVEGEIVDQVDAVKPQGVDGIGDVGTDAVGDRPTNVVVLDPMATLRVAETQRLEEEDAAGASTAESVSEKENRRASGDQLPLPPTDNSAISGADVVPAPLVELQAPAPVSEISPATPERLAGADEIPAASLPDSTVQSPAVAPAASESVESVEPQLAEPRPAAAVSAAPMRTTIRPAQQPQSQVGRTQHEYTGDPISMDFQGADLRSVLRTFAEISSLNIVIDPNVEGRVDVALRDVPWDQALDLILRSNRLGYIVDGTIIRIAPLSALADEEADRRKLAGEQALAGELIVFTRTLSYARAADMASLITQAVLSTRGQIQVDERTNTLIITDLQERLTTADELIVDLDRAEPQVEIEARIVQTNRNYARQLGIQWGVNGRVAPELGNTTPLSFPNRGHLSGRTGLLQGPGEGEAGFGNDARALEQEDVGTAVNLAATNATSAIGLALGAVDGAFNLDVALSALESEGHGRILSTPRATTQNNVTAEIIQGDQIPIQTVSNNTVTFQDAALTLRVTPQITAVNTVIMEIDLDNDVADFSRAVNGIPPIITQRARTTVQVADGETTVIGGIFESVWTEAHDRTPALHRIPLLGWLFKRDAMSDASDELLIFVTPHVLR